MIECNQTHCAHSFLTLEWCICFRSILLVTYSGQNLTLVRITTCVQWQKHVEALRIFISESQPRLNLTAGLIHSSSHPMTSLVGSPKSYSHPKPTWLQTECPATWWLYPSSRIIRGKLLRLAEFVTHRILFLIQNHQQMTIDIPVAHQS